MMIEEILPEIAQFGNETLERPVAKVAILKYLGLSSVAKTPAIQTRMKGSSLLTFSQGMRYIAKINAVGSMMAIALNKSWD